jgi:hypothetical protein
MNRQKLADFLRNLVQPENLTNLAAIVVAIVLGYRSIQTGAPDQYFQAMLAVLGVLALAQLVAGYSSTQRDARIRQLAETVATLEERMASRVNADSFLGRRTDFPSLGSTFQDAKQIEVMGISLLGLSTTHNAVLQHKRESGCCIRLITTNPSKRTVADLIAQRCPEAQNRDMHIIHVKTAISALSKICGPHPSGGNLEVRVLDTLPPFGLLAVDKDKPNGRIRIELYPDDCPVSDRPIFELLASRDDKWYSFFNQQFETLWQKASEVNV